MFLSLKIKIFIIISLSFLVLLSSNMFYDLYLSKKQLINYFDNLNKSSGKLLNINVRSDLYNLNFTKTKNTIKAFDNNYFKNIYILNKDGYIFAQRNEDKIIYKKYENFDKLLNSKDKDSLIYFQSIFISNKILGYLVIENNMEIYNKMKNEKTDEILNVFIIVLLFSVLISYIISLLITMPINNMIEIIKKTKHNKTLLFEHRKDEYGYLSKVIEKNHKEIKALNNNLEKRIEVEVEKSRKKDKILEDKMMMASMGEMMDAIAHQWRQPLNVIALINQNLYVESQLNTINENSIENAYNRTQIQVEHLSNTLIEFRNFFRPNKKVKSIILKNTIESSLILLADTIKTNGINVSLEFKQEKEVEIIPNEFKHVLINFINNSKDAFIENNIEYRNIKIKTEDKDNKVNVIVQDNAGGIPKDIIKNIFNANITSKKEGTGTGIGLYMSKMIIEKVEGTIEVKNKDEGAIFTISFKC